VAGVAGVVMRDGLVYAWHGRWTTEASPASIVEAQLALTCSSC
jgi:hypothetical protein